MKNLREKAAKLLADARELLAAADKESRGMSAEELQKYDAIMADFDAAQTTIRASEKLDAASQSIPAQTRQQAVAVPPGDTYREAFLSYVRTGDTRAAQTLTDASGGYAVADNWRSGILQGLEDENVMRGLSTVFTTTSGVLHVPVVTTHGAAGWTAEEAAFTEATDTFSEVTLDAYKNSVLVKVSEELLNDINFPLESYLSAEIGKKFGRLEETAFVTGDGSSKPTGVVGGAGLGKTATATNAITADELVDLYHSLGRAYRAKAVWLMKDSTVAAIRKLVTGVSGDKTYLWQPGLQAGEPDRLLGKPVVVSDNMAAIASAAKAIVFGDFSYYYIGERQAIGVQRLNELYAATGHVGFRCFRRVDGKVALAAAFKYLVLA